MSTEGVYSRDMGRGNSRAGGPGASAAATAPDQFWPLLRRGWAPRLEEKDFWKTFSKSQQESSSEIRPIILIRYRNRHPSAQRLHAERGTRGAPPPPTVVSRVGASVGGGHPRVLQSPSYSSAKDRGNSRRGGASRRRTAQRGPQPGGGRARRRAGGAFVKRRTARRHQWLQGGIVRWPWSHWRNLVLGEAAVGRAVDEHELPVP